MHKAGRVKMFTLPVNVESALHKNEDFQEGFLQ